MAEQEWLTAAIAPLPSPYENVVAAPGVAPPAFELRPLSLGELLDRTFSLYRSRFWLFAGISSVAAAVELLFAGVGRVTLHHYTKNPATVATAGIFVAYAVGFVYFLVDCVTQAATCFAMSEVYLGRPATIASAFRAVRGKWYAWIGIGWWQALSSFWLAIALMIFFFAARKFTLGTTGNLVLVVLAAFGFLGAVVYGVIAYIRNSLGIPVKVVEGITIRKAMRRSKDLSAGTKGRIFVLGLIVFALQMVAATLETPFAFMSVAVGTRTGARPFAEMAVLLITFVAHAVVTPIASIGLCLVYFDQRVRREAFDLEVLLGPEEASALPPHADHILQPADVFPTPPEIQADAPQF